MRQYAERLKIYIHIIIIIIIYYTLLYTIVYTGASTFFNNFFFFLCISFHSVKISAEDLKTFSGYLGVDLAGTKGPQKVICHPLLTRFIRQQKSKKKKIIRETVWSRCTWMGYGTFGGQLFFFLDPSKIDCRHRRLYQYSYFFLLRFCVFPLIDTRRMYLTNISFFPFKYLYTGTFYLSFFFAFRPLSIIACTVILYSYNLRISDIIYIYVYNMNIL